MEECLICGGGHAVTKHHLIPRTLHRNKWFKKRFTRDELRRTVPLCRECHSAVHAMFPDEKKMGRECGTPEALLSHEAIRPFVTWRRARR